MIGTWRWILALLVVNGHLFVPFWPATYAVFSFYVISGFLMTLIMNEQYGFSRKGIKDFWTNRFLRLYPAYFVTCLLSLLIIWWIPSKFVIKLNNKLIFPQSVFEVITNISILGLQQMPDRSSLVPPAWALSIELVYYIVISLWAGKNKRNAAYFFGMGILYLLVTFNHYDTDWWYGYFHLGAGALPFSVGVNFYFYKDKFQNIINRIPWALALFLSVTLYVMVFVVTYIVTLDRWPISIRIPIPLQYQNIITSAILLAVLWFVPQNKFRKIDSYFGKFSYPTYLLHWQVGIFVAYVTNYPIPGRRVLVIATVLVTILSMLEARFLSTPIEKIRKHIKNRASQVVQN